jgi:hypothetical protein
MQVPSVSQSIVSRVTLKPFKEFPRIIHLGDGKRIQNHYIYPEDVIFFKREPFDQRIYYQLLGDHNGLVEK